MKRDLPKSRNFGWKMKSAETAITAIRILKYGSFEATIEHDVVKGCSPKMIEWWFKNIGGTMAYQGKEHNRYLVWHPTDHILWELAKKSAGGKAEVGAKFRIVEAFNGNLDWKIDTTEEVTKLDDSGIRLSNKFLSLEVSCLEHWFIEDPLGTKYMSRLQVGSETPIGKYLINPLVHKYIMTLEMTRAWLTHNIEEVGNFEYFLPELYAREEDKL